MTRQKCYTVCLPIFFSSMILSGVFLFLHAEYILAAATVRYVAPSGECGPAEPCYASIQGAVDDAREGDETRIATGIYTGVNHYAGLSQLVYITKTVTLRGGYSTGDWEHSNPHIQPTTLDAGKLGRVIYISGQISPTLENLSIINGDATGLGGALVFPLGSAGGGIYALNATVAISNVNVRDNRGEVGSGMYFESGNLTMLDSQIISNTGAALGAGLFLQRNDTMLRGNSIENNIADYKNDYITWGYGGGLSVYAGNADLIGNRIANNHSRLHGGGIQFADVDGSLINNDITGNVGGTGGGAALSGNILILNNNISGNSGDGGGGITVFDGNMSLIDNTICSNRSRSLGGGIALWYYSSALDPGPKILIGNVISGNQARWEGGGAFLVEVRPVFKQNLIYNNHTDSDGGGFYIRESKPVMDGNSIISNTAEQDGGGIAIDQFSYALLNNTILAENQSNGWGSAIYLQRSTLKMSQATLANNIGSSSLSISAFAPLSQSIVNITNTIIASHTVGITATAYSTITLDGVLWFNIPVRTSGDGAFTITHAIEGDPAFTPGGYHLSAYSAALDVGINSGLFHDIDWEPRPYQGYDIGADEYWPPGVLKRFYFPLIFH